MSHALWTAPHSHVYLRCFFPSEDLDALLGLEDALQRKITQAAKSIGVEDDLPLDSKASGAWDLTVRSNEAIGETQGS